MGIVDWTLKVARWLGLKVIIYEHCHHVGNAVLNIEGIILAARKRKYMTKKEARDILIQTRRIEKSLNYVRKLNRGDTA